MINKKYYKFIEIPKKILANCEESFLDALFKVFPCAKKFLKKPVVKDNTFIVFEPCSKSHAEVVPGFCKYLLDLGYHVSVLTEPKNLKEGLFSKFNSDNISFNKLTSKQSKLFFRYGDLSKIKGVLTTTAGKLCNLENYDGCFEYFNSSIEKSKLFFVEHDIKDKVDLKTHRDDLITLRKMDYKGAKTVAVNPHYFGEVKSHDKNDVVNFLTVGVIKPRKKNNLTIIDAVLKLVENGIDNFKVTVVGKGEIKDIPQQIRKYFDIKGRLPFSLMYDEIEKADFILTSYDVDNLSHLRYITTGTSGNFQLIYGFLKPCLIIEKFAFLNGFNDKNSIIYKSASLYFDAMKKAVEMSSFDYSNMKLELKKYVDEIYSESLENLRELIEIRARA